MNNYGRVICDIRFTSQILVESLVGDMQSKGYIVSRLPLLNLPREILDNDENLKQQPLYKGEKGDVNILLGDRVLGISMDKVEKIDLDKISSFTDFIRDDFVITRLGFRVITKSNPNINIIVNGNKQDFDNYLHRISKNNDNFSNNIIFDTQSSSIDITIFKESECIPKNDIKEMIDNFMKEGKRIYDVYRQSNNQ